MVYLPWLLYVLMLLTPLFAEPEYDQDLVAYYPFTGNALDGTDNGHDGTVVGATLSADRFLRVDSAYEFDGVNDYISVPWSIHNDFTISFWVYTTQTAGAFNGSWWSGNGLIDGDICGSYPDFGIALCDTRVCFNDMISQNSINDGSWHHIIATRNMLAGEGTLYVDGELEAAGETSTLPVSGNSWLGVGNNPCDISNNRRWFNGRIDDIRFFDRVISESEIDSLFHEGGWMVAIGISNAHTPKTFMLKQGYPNPFNPTTTLEFTVQENSSIILQIYNVNGQLVDTLADAVVYAGTYSVVWNAHDFPSGLYFVCARSQNEHDIKNYADEIKGLHEL